MTFKLLISFIVSSFSPPDNVSNCFGNLNSGSDSTLKTGWYFISDKENAYKRKLDKDSKIYYINPIPIIRPYNITSVEIYQTNDSSYALLMRLDDHSTKLWQKATEETNGYYLAFIVDDILLYTPKVNSSIYNGIASLNRGIYSKQELERIKLILEKEKGQ
jgi:preprotein translocase subunit SecD